MAQIIIKDGEISSSAGINIPGSLTVAGNLNVNGTLTSAGGGGGSTNPGGADTAIQFNNQGAFSGSSNLIFDYTNNILSGTTSRFNTYQAEIGSAVAVSYGFGSSGIDTGIYRAATNQLGIATNGAEAVRFVNQVSGAQIQMSSLGGAAGAPTLTWNGDNNTGIFRPAADQIGFSTNATERLRITNTEITASTVTIIDVSSTSPALRITQRGTGYSIRVEDETNPDSTPFIVDNNGNVAIGATSTSSKLYVKGDTNISGALTIEGPSYIMGPSGESGIYNFKYIRSYDNLYLAGNGNNSGGIYLNVQGGAVDFFQNITGLFYVNGDVVFGRGVGSGIAPDSKLELAGTKPYLTLATTTTPTTPSAGKAAFWADSVYKEPYFKNENGDSINLADGGGATLMRLQGFTTANLTSTKTLTSNTTYALYLGKCPHYLLSGDVLVAKYRVTTLAATITWAEVAVATGLFVSSGPSTLTTRGFANIAAVVNSTGIKSTNITLASNIVPGTDMWLLFGVQATTPGVYRAASIADDIQTGVQLAAASTRPSTMAANTSFTVEGATALPIWMTLKV